jgi:HD-GYP domain-containing protein (c-di-GMP phosphodiesterase class II)
VVAADPAARAPFVELAHVAAAHHERLDGSGYFRGLGAAQLDQPSRILAVADVAEALSAQRPYREGLAPEAVLAIMRPEAGRTLDAAAFAALEEVLPAWVACVCKEEVTVVGDSPPSGVVGTAGVRG